MDTTTLNEIRGKVDRVLEVYYQKKLKTKPFIPGKTEYSGPFHAHEALHTMVGSILEGWFGVGKHAYQFGKKFPPYLGMKYVSLTNSGFYANLIVLAALKSNLSKEKLEKDEIIVPALTFSTAFNSMIQNDFVPVVVDVMLGEL